MLLLTGEFDLVLDDKFRLIIPARLREQIDTEKYGSGFYLVWGENRILSLYPEKLYQRMALAVAPRMVAPDDRLTFERVNFALAGRVELDRQGRVLIGEKAVSNAQLDEEIKLIGVRDHLEIWDRSLWRSYLEQNQDFYEKMLMTIREEYHRQEREMVDEI